MPPKPPPGMRYAPRQPGLPPLMIGRAPIPTAPAPAPVPTAAPPTLIPSFPSTPQAYPLVPPATLYPSDGPNLDWWLLEALNSGTFMTAADATVAHIDQPNTWTAPQGFGSAAPADAWIWINPPVPDVDALRIQGQPGNTSPLLHVETDPSGKGMHIDAQGNLIIESISTTLPAATISVGAGFSPSSPAFMLHNLQGPGDSLLASFAIGGDSRTYWSQATSDNFHTIALFVPSWIDSTEATRKGQFLWQVTDAGGVRDVLKAWADGTAGRLDVFGKTSINLADALTATIADALVIDHQTSGTPAAGFGSRILFTGETSTTAGREIAFLEAWWANATDATRMGLFTLQCSDATTHREVLRGESNGSAAAIGFLGAAAVVRQTLPAAASDPTTTQTLANSLRTILINLGLAA